jgi:hypothetical protein
MSKNIIKLNEDCGIGSDELHFILYQRKVNKKEETKNFGKEYYSPIGYYSCVEAVLRALINKQIQLSIPEQTTLESLVCSVETYVSLLHDNVVKIVKSLR